MFVPYKVDKLCCGSIADKFLFNLAMINIALVEGNDHEAGGCNHCPSRQLKGQ